jgi:hypothetical protein
MDGMTITRFDSESFCGYTQITTFFEDFSIAEHFGAKAIQDTYLRAFKEWKTNYKYLTELVMVLNWKIWQWYGKNDEYAQMYNDLWEVADLYATENLKGEELDYFYKTTD